MHVKRVIIVGLLVLALLGGSTGIAVAAHDDPGQCGTIHEGGEGAENAADEGEVDRAHQECHGNHQQDEADR